MKAFLDTHAAAALAENPDLLGHRARGLIERAALFISPIVRLELEFLYELDRIETSGEFVVEVLEQTVGLVVAADSIVDIVSQAIDLEWTRDPFDRLLVATARLHRAPLITKDRSILEHFPDAVW